VQEESFGKSRNRGGRGLEKWLQKLRVGDIIKDLVRGRTILGNAGGGGVKDAKSKGSWSRGRECGRKQPNGFLLRLAEKKRPRLVVSLKKKRGVGQGGVSN